MKNYKQSKNNLLIFLLFFFFLILIFPNITVRAETSESVEWIKNNWLNYPSDIGKWTKTQNGSPLEINKAITISNDIGYGNHTLTVWAKDSENGESKKEIINFSINDITKPTATHSITSETDGTKTIKIVAKDSESGIKRIKLPNGNYVNSTTTNYEITSNGNYTFSVEDNVGNINNYTINISNLVFKPILSVQPHNDEDYISLDWSISDTSQPYTYKLFQEKNNSGEFQSISTTNFENVQQVKVLNIYPKLGNNLKKWMENPNSEDPNGYGKGIIKVDEVNITDFNLNPSLYLKNEDGTWKYDVLMFGTWDANNYIDISTLARDEVELFIQAGKGVLFGHDTTCSNNKWTNFTYLGTKYLNMSNDGVDSSRYTVVYTSKKGLLTNYPWNIGEIGTKLTIPSTHSFGQGAYGDIWMRYDLNSTASNNFYLTTWNNTAMIQTGHSNASATADEQKLLANTLFYLNQLTSDTFLDDYSGQDVNAPTIPSVTGHSFNNKNITVSFTGSTDVGTLYRYYVEATGQNNGAKTNSDIKETTIMSGLKGYSYIVDTNPTTIPDNTIETSTPTNINFTITNKTMYVHLKAIDNVGNASETVHYKVEDLTKPTLSITGNATSWTNKDITLNISANDLESGFSYILLPNGNKVTSSTTSYTVSSNGTYIFKAYDNVGNETTVNVVVNKIDKELPIINYTKEFNADKTSGYINLSVIDSLSGFSKLELPTGEIIITSTYKYPINNNGMYLFTAWDKANNESVIVVTVNELNTNDTASGISKIEYKLSGATVQDWTTYTEPFYITNEGITTITARSYDKAGNISSEATSQVKIDKTKPINNGIEIKLK